MNNKNDILDAWITIEQLSEGSITKETDEYKFFDEQQKESGNIADVFFSYLIKQKAEQSISDKKFKDSGIVLYFDVFDFEEIKEFLRKEYNIFDNEKELKRSHKFMFALYFDSQLKFLPKKLFYTVSGYIRNNKVFPENISKEEENLSIVLREKFQEEGFNETINYLLNQFKVELNNCQYAFIKDFNNYDAHLHSFFIDELEKAKKKNTPNLNRYFNGFTGNRINLNSNKDTSEFNPKEIQNILQPKNYPLGRFLGDSNHSLALMQEIAINLTLNDTNSIRSVNGPPGTGKTTLLKDIFSDLVVQQAHEICEMNSKTIFGELMYESGHKFGKLPQKITDKNIVVASSNNGAVQNIVNELPQLEKIAEEFKESILQADYFKEIANTEVSITWKNEKRTVSRRVFDDKNWGMFSAEGGNTQNLGKLIEKITMIEENLTDEYSPNSEIYKEFSLLYEQLVNEQNKVQKYYEDMKKLLELKQAYTKTSTCFLEEKRKTQVKIKQFYENKKKQLESLQNIKNETMSQIKKYEEKLEIKRSFLNKAQRDFEILQTQKPNLLWLQKVLNKKKVISYQDKLRKTSDELNCLEEQQRNLIKTKKNLSKKHQECILDSENIQTEIQKIIKTFVNWEQLQQQKITDLKEQILSLESLNKQYDIPVLDFSVSYDDFQLSNPWFTKEFRIKQSELFIKALEVRKQFLYENKEHLKIAKKIWSFQDKYIYKENGKDLVKNAWYWVNFVIPVISTTFASFGRMFKNLPENSISNLFIDEAGQALPQASVGAIFRSKKILVVGDPAQIKPVLSLDPEVLSIIARYYGVDEKFISLDASTQTIMDAASQYGFKKNENEWIGIPLWVHRRSSDSMFTISNEISYDKLMVQGIRGKASKGKAKWFDISGIADNKFVKEQAIFLKKLIENRSSVVPMEEIYVITPFKNVAINLRNELKSFNFSEHEKNIKIGTVHTFQGKEADVVYLVLGADTNNMGTARWAVCEPNIINVAVTRAKKEFYIIGDKRLYSSLGSTVINKIATIIDDYNSITNY
ncbi:AAA family ATPase [Enterococcus faecalis]|nr:AAA family ATPase [Enterococcus faecalis]